MPKIYLSKDISADLNHLVESRFMIQANSGGGKSWAIRRFLEQSHGKVQHIILDIEGEFSTLREDYDYILAGKDGDIPADPRSAALLARKLLELNVSAIIDLYELHAHERKQFVKIFLDAMVNAPKNLWHPCIVVLDEAHVFAPQVGQSEALQSVIDMATRGRKRGFCLVPATQRLSKLHKDVAAECNNKLIGRTGLDVDMKRAAEELGFTTKEQLLSLRALAPGEFYAFGPAISTEVVKFKIGEVHTTHKPKTGSKAGKVTPPTAAIHNILGKLSDLPQEAKKEAQTVQELKNEIISLKRQKVATTPSVVTKKDIEEALQPHLTAFASVEQGYKNILDQWEQHVVGTMEIVNRMTIELREHDKGRPSKNPGVSFARPRTLVITKNPAVGPAEKVIINPITKEQSHDGDVSISPSEQKLLNAIAWYESISIENPSTLQVALVAGYTVNGHFNNLRGNLRTKGMIEYDGSGGNLLTQHGRGMAQYPEKTLTTQDIHDKVFKMLSPSESKIMQVLIDHYPAVVPTDQLAAESNYTVNGHFNNMRGRLRSLGIAEYVGGGTAASSILFL